MVRLTAKLMDIDYPGLMLNREDARKIGVIDGGRVQVINEETGVFASACVTTTETILEKGTFGIFYKTNERLMAREGSVLEVRIASRPLSLDYIKKKMDGGKFSKEETNAIVNDIVNDVLSPSEMGAYITSSYINGLDMDEVEHLTRAMVATGDQLKFTSHPIVDKHSIGGVPGNKISFLVVPIIAAAGLKIPKTSSRAITGAGGTADLMEVLAPVSFSASEVQKMTEKVGGTIVWGGATNIAPADDKIIIYEYPFKIDARGQMLASVMAKKFAVGADLVVIDIPVGQHAKVTTPEEGRKLAREFIELGERLGIKVECALTYGESPIGHAIGVNLEVREALWVLEGAKEPNSLIQKSTSIAGIALEMSGKAQAGGGLQAASDILASGKALEKMREIIEVQGGDPKVMSEDILPGQFYHIVKAPESGYVVEMNNHALITIARAAGAPHDRGAGIYIHKKKGHRVEKGDPIFMIYADRSWRLEKAVETARQLMPMIVEGMLIDRVPSSYWRGTPE
ncbi:AMP phosphorylase [Methanoplanus sp. FWC-SCC4]|uniref:AMP phosphorylase n=1 Tax=Methanochimaera problematica TaxID=2609417 RepID=A0AA97I4V2_9EURY|nr:AMP phosphorylase [Methanoplanus sp. FWC-SCC4]WOF16756.1 AMP phosphorylase [Methanoplanus sp. FWC-SCC4]